MYPDSLPMAGGQGPHPPRPRVVQDSTKGMLKWNGDSRARALAPPVSAIHQSTRSPAEICLNFLYMGKACSRGRDCPFVHIRHARDLPQASQQPFIRWVVNTNNVDWATRAPVLPRNPRAPAP